MNKLMYAGFGGLIGLMFVAFFSFIFQELAVTNDSCWWNTTGPTVMLIPFFAFFIILIVGVINTICKDDF